MVAPGYSNTSYDENIFLLERLTCLTSMSTSPDFQIIFDKMPLAGLFQHTQKSHAKKKNPKKYSSLAKSNKKKKKKQNWLVMRSEWNSTIIPRILKGLTAYLRQLSSFVEISHCNHQFDIQFVFCNCSKNLFKKQRYSCVSSMYFQHFKRSFSFLVTQAFIWSFSWLNHEGINKISFPILTFYMYIVCCE